MAATSSSFAAKELVIPNSNDIEYPIHDPVPKSNQKTKQTKP
jgi:hypothetical protein